MSKFNISIFIIILGFVLSSLIYSPLPARAADSCNGIKLQVAIPGIGNCVKDFPTYIKTLYKFFISIVGILAVIMIMVGGFQWLLAAGNAQKIAGAKTTILSAIMGLVLALTSYTILYIINPDILKLKMHVSQVSLEEPAAEGYCSSNDDIFLFGDTYAECGKIYQLKDKEDRFCMGIECFNESVEACIGSKESNEFKCLETVTINDKQMGYGNRVWTSQHADPVSNLKVSKDYQCGTLFVATFKLLNLLTTDQRFNFGTQCQPGQTCNIDIDKGVEFYKKYSEVVETKEGDKVGKLLGSKCLPQPEGSW